MGEIYKNLAFKINMSNNSCRLCRKNNYSHSEIINQNQKIIQNVVRVKSSLYTMNLAGLNVYQSPLESYQLITQNGSSYIVPPGSNWNQMSDRAKPSNQLIKTGSYGSNSLKRSKLSNKPGSMSPGGLGVDIKHNSYERYLNRLKGKGLLKKGIVQISDGQKMTGGKKSRLAIVNNCNCINNEETTENQNYNISEFDDAMYNLKYNFKENDIVLVKKNKYDNLWYRGIIIQILNNIFLINFGNGILEEININFYKTIPYFKKNFNCVEEIDEPKDFTTLVNNSEICEKQYLLETGIVI